MSADADLMLRLADAEAGILADGERIPHVGATRIVARTVSLGDYPTQPGRYFAMETVVLRGNEFEGAAATATPSGDTFYAYNLGTAVPPVHTILEVTAVPYSMVFRYDP